MTTTDAIALIHWPPCPLQLPERVRLGQHAEIVDVPAFLACQLSRLDSPSRRLRECAQEALERLAEKIHTSTTTHMTLSFATVFPGGKPTLFLEKIVLPYRYELRQQYPDLIPKIHTFRLGARWRAGMKMHMVYGNRTKERRQFNLEYPELDTCHGVQKCFITCLHAPQPGIRIEIDGTVVNDLLFMANDGFDSPDQFYDWFGHPFKTVTHEGQIVHWTDFRY